MLQLATFAVAALVSFQCAFSNPLPFDATSLKGLYARSGIEERAAPAAPHFALYSDKWTGGSPPPVANLTGWNTFIMSYWLSDKGPFDNVAAWQALTAAQRKTIHSQYNAAGIKLMISAFGSTDPVTTNNRDPTNIANKIATFVTTYGPLDGVDVDYEDLQAMNGGTAEKWLITFTTQLRNQLPATDYLITHAPLAPWFTDGNGPNGVPYPGGGYLKVHNAVGPLIDWYNIQYYNQGTEYTTCASLITQSSPFPHTAVLEIVANGVPAKKVVLGKPAKGDYTNGGFMTPAALATCVNNAKNKGWNGGLMVWQYPDEPATYVQTVWGS